MAYWQTWSGLETVGRAYWLPPTGQGNGLDAASWAPILVVEPRVARRLLGSLGAWGVPAFAGPESPRRPRSAWRLWVDPRHYAQAQDIIASTLGRVVHDPDATGGQT